MVKHYLQQNSDTCQADFRLLPQKPFLSALFLSAVFFFARCALFLFRVYFFLFYFNLVVKPFTTSFWPLVESKVFRLYSIKCIVSPAHIQTATIYSHMNIFHIAHWPTHFCSKINAIFVYNGNVWFGMINTCFSPDIEKKFINKIFALSKHDM